MPKADHCRRAVTLCCVTVVWPQPQHTVIFQTLQNAYVLFVHCKMVEFIISPILKKKTTTLSSDPQVAVKKKREVQRAERIHVFCLFCSLSFTLFWKIACSATPWWTTICASQTGTVNLVASVSTSTLLTGVAVRPMTSNQQTSTDSR